MVVAMMAMEHGFIPPTLNLKDIDPACEGLDYVAGKAREHKINRALIISRGRAGINAALVMEKA
jgi:3-oxoacyl-[acyl-carrier-protein] synthase II